MKTFSPIRKFRGKRYQFMITSFTRLNVSHGDKEDKKVSGFDNFFYEKITLDEKRNVVDISPQTCVRGHPVTYKKNCWTISLSFRHFEGKIEKNARQETTKLSHGWYFLSYYCCDGTDHCVYSYDDWT